MQVAARLVLLLAWAAGGCGAASVLALLHYPGGSHFHTLGRLARGLAAAGHNVTVVSHSPSARPIPNYTDLSIKGQAPPVTDTFNFERLAPAFKADLGVLDANVILGFAMSIFNLDFNNCKAAYEHPIVQDLIRSIRSGERRFDALLVHTLMVDCFDPLAQLLEAPLIAVSTSVMTPWCSDRVANPHNPAYVGTYFLPYETGNMGFYERFLNTFYYLLIKHVRQWTLQVDTAALHRRHLGADVPPLWQSVSSTSLVLVNSHWSISGAIPLLPNVVEVGGLHIEESQPIPQELAEILQEAVGGAGAVLVSFGSLFALHTLPLAKLHALLDALGRLEQIVLLRCHVAKLPEGVRLPSNVVARNWLPQTALLAHGSMRAFVSHGGMHSTVEAVHFGVPVVGMPLFVDQKLTINRLQSLGVAIHVDYNSLTAESLAGALHTVINDSRYAERARQLSALFRDRPRPPLQEAVFWVERAIRQRRSRSPGQGQRLGWFQRLLLHASVVAAIATVSTAALVYLLYLLCLRMVYFCVVCRRAAVKEKAT